jgi:hypothetical protein
MLDYARGYALEAERKMGEILTTSERAQGKRTDLVTPSNQVGKPTLAELGLSKRESSEAQMLADIPDETFSELKAGKISRKKIKKSRTHARDTTPIRIESSPSRPVPP